MSVGARPGRLLRGPQRVLAPRGALTTSVLMAALGLLLLLPRAHGWVALHAHKEDAEIFLSGALVHGAGGLLEPYSGYLHVAPRLLAEVALTGPLAHAPLAIAALTTALRVLLAVFATHALAPYAPSLGWARAAGSLVVLAPVGQQEALGNLTNLRWFLVVGATLALWAVTPRPAWAVTSAVVAALAALSDPLVLGLAPVALVRAFTLRGYARLPGAALVLGAVVHAFALDVGARPPDGSGPLDRPGAYAAQVAVRGLSESLLGQGGTEAVLLVAGVAGGLLAALAPLALLAVALWRPLDRGAVLLAASLVAAGTLVVAATLLFADLEAIDLTNWWSIGQASRYAVVPSVLGGAGVVLAAGWAWRGRGRAGRAVAVLALAALAGAVAVDSLGDPASTDGPRWSTSVANARAECEGAPRDTGVVLPATPQGVQHRWALTTTCGALAEQR